MKKTDIKFPKRARDTSAISDNGLHIADAMLQFSNDFIGRPT